MAAKPGSTSRGGAEPHGGEFSDELKYAIEKSSAAVAGVVEGLASPGTLDATLRGFCTGMKLLESASDNAAVRGICIRARLDACGALLTGRHFEEMAQVILTSPEADTMVVLLAELEMRVALFAPGADQRLLRRRVFERLHEADPKVRKGVLRIMRDNAIQEGNSGAVVDWCDAMLSLGESDYDPISDWQEYEAAKHPLADWQGIADLLRKVELWPRETPAHRRKLIAQDRGRSISDIHAGGSPEQVKMYAKKFEELAVGIDEEIRRSPAEAYLYAMMATAFYRVGMAQTARLITRELQGTVAAGYLAESLLRLGEQHVEEAKKIIFALPNPRDIVDMLIDGSWPDRTTPTRILHDIVTFTGKRTGKGPNDPFISVYPVEMRIDCLRALADRCEGEGKVEEATTHRKVADQLRRLLNNHLIKHMPRVR
jgi:hypothetical protein